MPRQQLNIFLLDFVMHEAI